MSDINDHVRRTDEITLSGLEHVAHCDSCYNTNIAPRRGESMLMEVLRDFAQEFKDGAHIVYDKKEE